tara:strand:+ start:91 stop:552 length:462 start_codon:yes stop_codon:yes gene_type:complete
MIIECINCSKKFEVDSNLIPLEGRTIQCGSCNHVWFFKKSDKNYSKTTKTDISENYINPIKSRAKSRKLNEKKKSLEHEKKGSEIVEYTPKSSFTFGNFLSYIVVILISFIALIIILDTFKIQLYSFFPDLEIWLFSLYEILKDIQLFIRDLI